MEMSRLEMAHRGFFFFCFEMDDFSSQASTQPLEPMSGLHLKAETSGGIIPASAQTKHQPAFIWFRGRWAGVLSSLIRPAS